MPHEYPAPVDELLTYGEARHLQQWPNYLFLGVTKDHIPDLILCA